MEELCINQFQQNFLIQRPFPLQTLHNFNAFQSPYYSPIFYKQNSSFCIKSPKFVPKAKWNPPTKKPEKLFTFSKLNGEQKNFFAPNTKLVIYNLFKYRNATEIFKYCNSLADFIPPIVIFYEDDGKYSGQVMLRFENVTLSKMAFNKINSKVNYPVFAEFGNPNEKTDFDKINQHPQLLLNSQNSEITNVSIENVTKNKINSTIGENNFLSSILMPNYKIKRRLVILTNNMSKNSTKLYSWIITPFFTIYMLNILNGNFSKIDDFNLFFRLNSENLIKLLNSFKFLPQIVLKTCLDMYKCIQLPVICSEFINKTVDNFHRRVLTVSAKTQVKAIAGAIAHTVRKMQCPIILSGGAEGINLTIKAIAIAREYLIEDQISLYCFLEKSNDFGGFRFIVMKDSKQLFSTKNMQNFLGVSDSGKMLKVSKHSKVIKIANLILKFLRNSRGVSMGSMGSGSVFQTIKALIIAAKILERQKLEIVFQPKFISLFIGGCDSEKRSVLKLDVKVIPIV